MKKLDMTQQYTLLLLNADKNIIREEHSFVLFVCIHQAINEGLLYFDDENKIYINKNIEPQTGALKILLDYISSFKPSDFRSVFERLHSNFDREKIYRFCNIIIDSLLEEDYIQKSIVKKHFGTKVVFNCNQIIISDIKKDIIEMIDMNLSNMDLIIPLLILDKHKKIKNIFDKELTNKIHEYLKKVKHVEYINLGDKILYKQKNFIDIIRNRS
ncbi:MAG: hypothetical protein ACRC5R_03695 [Mycoplasmatales bacterium]